MRRFPPKYVLTCLVVSYHRTSPEAALSVPGTLELRVEANFIWDKAHEERSQLFGVPTLDPKQPSKGGRKASSGQFSPNTFTDAVPCAT